MLNIILPKKLHDAILNLQLNEIQTNHAFEFINFLFKLNVLNRNNNQDNSFMDIPSKVLREKFTKDYSKKFLSKMVNASIIIRSPYCNNAVFDKYNGPSCNKNKPFGYRINDDFLDFNDLTCYSLPIQKKSKPEKKINWVISDLKRLDFNIAEMLSDINNYSIDNQIRVNTEISDSAVEVMVIKNPNKNINTFIMKTDKALKLSRRLNLDLILFKGNAYIMNLEYFKKLKINQFKISQFYQVAKLMNQEFYASINKTNNRLDTNLTNLRSSYLKNGHVTLEGEKMVDVDLKNSQPTLLAFLLSNMDVVKRKFPSITDYKFPDIDLNTPDVKSFCQLTGTGQFYDHLATISGWSRPEAKLAFLKIMFSKPQLNSSHKKLIKEIFPTLIKWMDNFKKLNSNHECLAIMFQKIESQIFIKNIYKSLRKDHVIFTKHDSILCRLSERDIVKQKMEKILDEYGFKYKLE